MSTCTAGGGVQQAAQAVPTCCVGFIQGGGNLEFVGGWSGGGEVGGGVVRTV